MRRPPPRATRTYTLCPYTTFFRSALKLRPAELDIENIATGIEDLGKRDFRSLQCHCATAIEHLLKLAWSIRDEPRAGWLATIRRHRAEIHLLLQDKIGRAACRERVCQYV